jgi:hypothetical protein
MKGNSFPLCDGARVLEEISYLIAQYERAAVNARSAEFDGVEIHAANGHLIDHSSRAAPTDAPMPMAARSLTGRGCWKRPKP